MSPIELSWTAKKQRSEMLTKTIQVQSQQCVDGVGGVTARQVRFVIELGVEVRVQTTTERGNLDACQFNFALFICSSEKQQKNQKL